MLGSLKSKELSLASDQDEENEEGEDQEVEGEDQEEIGDEEDEDEDEDEDGNEDEDEDGNEDEDDEERNERARKAKRKTLKTENKFKDEYENRGVLYIARVPPYMKPAKIRHLLGQYGTIHRIYLAPEDPNITSKRRKAGGNRKKSFTEGWVEFASKKIAKRLAYSLNNTSMGGSKRNYYHDDLWMVKYLRGFKWHNLTEKIAYEKAVREQKLRAQISQAKRENNMYLAKRETATTVQKIEERKRKQQEKEQKKNKKAKPTSSSSPSSAPPAKKT